MMDHTVAHETYAAERYLLGEMPHDEREEFEEHFFCCRICGANVEAASVFVANAKAVVREKRLKALPVTKRVQRTVTWLKWSSVRRLRLPVIVPWVAALALAAVVIYQNAVVIPALEIPRSMASPVFLDGEVRDAAPEVRDGRPLRFQVVLVHGTESDRVAVTLLDASGRPVRRGSVESSGPETPLDVYFPGRLTPGRYTLLARSLRGLDAGQELARIPFEVVSRN